MAKTTGKRQVVQKMEQKKCPFLASGITIKIMAPLARIRFRAPHPQIQSMPRLCHYRSELKHFLFTNATHPHLTELSCPSGHFVN